MAEVTLQPDDTHEDVAKRLIDKAGPDNVSWSPRPDVPGGGVYVVNDEAAVASFVRERQQRRDEEAARQAKAEQFAAERDGSDAVASGLATPSEVGFPASIGSDPGAGEDSEDDEEDGDEGDDSDEETPEEPKQTVAQKRAAKKAAPAKAEGSSEEGK